jgi:cytochrome c oxidase subunit 3
MMTLNPAAVLPSDFRAKQGGLLFLGMLFVFFASSLLLYAFYASSRRDDPYSTATLPWFFLASTGCLVAISGFLHLATRTVRRDHLAKTTILLFTSLGAALVFLVIQVIAMIQMIQETTLEAGNGRGLVGMVVVLAFLHALHVAGGVIALGIVGVRAGLGRYDHERHFAIDFAAQYWHFLDAIWIAMLVAFCFTTGGF